MHWYKLGEKIALRDGVADALAELGRTNDKVIALSADLTESVRMNKFAEEFPHRFFNTGIQEQNMAAAAAGLALEGYIPFIGSFANFQPGRNFDQIRTSICMMNANVKIISSHAGFSYGEDGVTVQMLEDVTMMRALPNMKVIVPLDANQVGMAIRWAAAHDGPVYIRLGRAAAEVLTAEKDAESLQFGKAQVLRDGNDVTIIGYSYMAQLALQAAKELAKQGIDVRVLNMHTIKPLDVDAIKKAVSQTKALVTVEDHQVAGGLGGAVAEVVAQLDKHIPMKIIGVEDQFGETGSSAEVMTSRGLTIDNIIQSATNLFAASK